MNSNNPHRAVPNEQTSGQNQFLYAIGFAFFAGGLCLLTVVAGGIYLAITEPAAGGPNPPSVLDAVISSIVALLATVGGFCFMTGKRSVGGLLVAVCVLTVVVVSLWFLLNANFRGP